MPPSRQDVRDLASHSPLTRAGLELVDRLRQRTFVRECFVDLRQACRSG